ncbi:LysR substrate-binding domain-containing protein [Nisaea acidiphila]|uniref:LysR substrate-binding domain-containing protein n=1 Tax=Nisaea acidiphila TaxID=1862145 RepID=A0A9J7AL18_9PROT|nr:LysR substrate-binding domain-containing protein [Nisaea acidiphila]UUX48184.1 LysR substrate-binding domain-containing protein [Nisaea acidiphila]
MSLRRLQIFLEVAARGSFAAAADRLGLAQSAVSMQMRNLEEELGADLFDRSRRPPVLNDRGLALVPEAREVLTKYDDLKRIVRGGGAIAGTLRLGVIQTASTGVLPGALTALHEHYPDLRVRIESGLSAGLLGRVVHGELDAAILTAPERLPGELKAHLVFEEPLSVIAPKAFTGGSDADLLTRHPFIRFNRRTGVGRIIEHALRDRALSVDEAMELDAIEPIIEMVSCGLGVAVVPDSALGRETREAIRVLPFGDPVATRQVIVVERHASPRAALTEVLVAALTGLLLCNIIT